MQRFSPALFMWVVLLGFAGPPPAPAQTDFSGTATAKLTSFKEVPSVFGFGSGTFEASVNAAGDSMDWDLRYDHLSGSVTQAHIHFAEEHVNGGIVVFFCSNLGNAPAGTPACPSPPAHLSGTFDAEDIVAGAQAQGIAPPQFKALLWSMRRGATYVNVHSDRYPSGEIRGQIHFQRQPTTTAITCCMSACLDSLGHIFHPDAGVNDIVYRDCRGGRSSCDPGETQVPCNRPNCEKPGNEGDCICDGDSPGPNVPLCGGLP